MPGKDSTYSVTASNTGKYVSVPQSVRRDRLKKISFLENTLVVVWVLKLCWLGP